MKTLLVGIASGAALMYFFDPEKGNARRAQLADQLGAAKRRTERDIEKQIRHRSNQAQGAMHEAQELAGRAN
jgi:hypothetical protein